MRRECRWEWSRDGPIRKYILAHVYPIGYAGAVRVVVRGLELSHWEAACPCGYRSHSPGVAMAQLKIRSDVLRGETASRASTIAPQSLDLFTEEQWTRLAAALMLTPRQSEVARLLCAGHTYQSVALYAGISINTARMHIRALFQKLGAHDRVGFLIRMISAERGLGECPTVQHHPDMRIACDGHSTYKEKHRGNGRALAHIPSRR